MPNPRLNAVCRAFLSLTPAVAAYSLSVVHASVRQDDEIKVQVDGQLYVNGAGNGRVRMIFRFDPPRAYDRVKRNYPNLYVLFRDNAMNRSNIDLIRSSLKTSSDDASRTITFVGDVLGVAECRVDKWYLPIPREEKIVTRVGNRIFTTSVERSEDGMLMTGKLEYVLPGAAKISEYAPDKQLLSYTLPVRRVSGKPEVDVHLRSKKRIMSALHKIYADSEMDNGAHWVGKLVVHNTGKVPIYDVRISFQLGEYSDESVPQKFAVVAPGGAVVVPYFPIISAKVAQLRSRTPAELRVRYEYHNAAGKKFSDQVSERVDILGINQFEYSNLSDDDRTDSWFDKFNNAPLLSAFVMRTDEAVRQFAGIVSDAAGGVASFNSPQEARQWLKAAYDQQLRNNIVYTSNIFFTTADKSGVQELKYPRDVFRDKAGTCIDLAITFASLAENGGLKSYLVLVPGHCFASVELPNGEVLRVENTGLGGGVNRMTFEQALAKGQEAYAKAEQEGLLLVVDVAKELAEGRVSHPELPALPADYLSKLGIRKR